MRLFLGITGVKESGKTTSFNFIKAAYPEVIEVTLAKKLKDVCAEVLGIPRNAFDDQALKEKELLRPVCLTQANLEALIQAFGYTPDYDRHVRPHIGVVLDTARLAAQYVGTEVLRAVDENVHCVGATRDLPEEGIFVVTDMRFPNEYNFFKSRYPETFYPVYISNYAAEARLGPSPHASERYVLSLANQCDRVDNNGTKEELRERILTQFRRVREAETQARRQYA